MNKILSIIVPSYNMEKYLPKCLGSLVIDDAELLQKLDVIVVNDGSKDRTSEIAHDFEAKYPGVFRVIDKTNGHYGSCVNAALPVALGTYVKILDADDYVDTAAFEQFCRLAEKESSKGDDGADLLVSNYQSVDSDGTIVKRVNYALDEKHGYYTLDEYQDMENRFTVHSIAYRTNNVRAMGYHQTEGVNYTDTEWIIEPMTQVRRLVFQRQPVTCYLVDRDGQSTEEKVFAKNFSQILEITIWLATRYKKYCAICVNTAKKYYTHQVLRMIFCVYSKMFLNLSGKAEYRGDFVSFDKQLKELSPELYEKSSEITFTLQRFPWRYFPLYYVRKWRKHYKLSTWLLLLYARC